MKISPKYNNEDWNKLNLSKTYSDNWEKGATIVEDRIHGRFLAQIKLLENNPDKDIWEYSGFIIMAVDCMVIETLNQFYLGIENTNAAYNKKNKDSFKEFFERSEFFRLHFDDEKSSIFYDHVRNGLLHQAQTKKKTLINMKEPNMIEFVNSNKHDDGIIVNRKKFHKALVDEFNSYTNKLKEDNPNYDYLRENCIKKMKTICQI